MGKLNEIEISYLTALAGLAAIKCNGFTIREKGRLCGEDMRWLEDTWNYEQGARSGGMRMLVCPQFKLGNYRADFWIGFCCFGTPVVQLIVEIDGHEFHRRTKEQAEYEDRRTRYFAENGLNIIRFSGREIYRDAEGCAYETYKILRSRSEA